MMRRRGRGRAIFCVIAAIALGITINTQAIAEDDGETAEPNADEVSASEPVVEPYVERLLNDVGEYIGAAQAFTFEADVTYEEATDEGSKIQYGGNLKVAVRRPDSLYVRFKGDQRTRSFWLSGGEFTILAEDKNLYAESEVPETIDEALDFILDSLEVNLPLIELAYDEPHKLLMSRVESAYYVGEHEVNGIDTHHIALTQEGMEWEIWIEDDTLLVPRKLVINYRDLPGNPQFTAIIGKWNLNPSLGDRLFRPAIPTDAILTEFLSISDSSTP